MIKHDNHSFFLTKETGEVTAKMEYSESEKILIIASTFVDDALRGQGVGRRLLDEVVNLARSKNKKVLPLCPYALSVFRKDETLADVWER